MNPLEIILLDDDPDAQDALYPEQRAQLFESWWKELSFEKQRELADANPR